MIGAEIRLFLWGALFMASATAAIFFFRYWRSTLDRLFILFGVAFAVLTLNWAGLALVHPSEESRHLLYLLRLAAFLLIIVAIVDKNRR